MILLGLPILDTSSRLPQIILSVCGTVISFSRLLTPRRRTQWNVSKPFPHPLRHRVYRLYSCLQKCALSASARICDWWLLVPVMALCRRTPPLNVSLVSLWVVYNDRLTLFRADMFDDEETLIRDVCALLDQLRDDVPHDRRSVDPCVPQLAIVVWREIILWATRLRRLDFERRCVAVETSSNTIT